MNVDDYTQEEVDSCHTRRLRVLDVREMDPSMLIGFLIKDREDWRAWKAAIGLTAGKAIIHIADKLPISFDTSMGRAGALDEVESFDEDEEDADTILGS